MNEENTFGDYNFPEWIPEHERETIRSFWGWAGRTYEDWIKSGSFNATETCGHGPGPNGFANPPMGATCDYFIHDYALSKDIGKDRYKLVRGRYIHRWNNIGSLIDENGEVHNISSCNRWVRVWQDGEKQQ